MGIRSRTLTLRTRSARRLPYLLVAILQKPAVLALYALAVFGGFAFLIGIIDLFRLGPRTPSVWPELEALAGGHPVGLVFLAPLIVAGAFLSARGLDRALDSLDPA